MEIIFIVQIQLFACSEFNGERQDSLRLRQSFLFALLNNQHEEVTVEL
jgi:hypothetical protein